MKIHYAQSVYLVWRPQFSSIISENFRKRGKRVTEKGEKKNGKEGENILRMRKFERKNYSVKTIDNRGTNIKRKKVF